MIMDTADPSARKLLPHQDATLTLSRLNLALSL